MASGATSVEDYLASLPADRRDAISAVRAVILKNLDTDLEEGIQYGMIGYFVPHRVYPAGYHCDPRQPLPVAALASQKNHMSLHLMCLYGDTDRLAWFTRAWAATGKKLDMGKACVRFKSLDNLALDVVGELFSRTTARDYIRCCEAALQASSKRRSARTTPAARKKTASKPPKKATRKTAKKRSKSTR